MPDRRVEVSNDHIMRVSRCLPERAIEELIWNALDSGSDTVEVSFRDAPLGGVESIEVIDTGSGISPQQLERAFGRVGDSEKVTSRTTASGRPMHGSEGRGRFKSLVLGTNVTWTTCANDEDGNLAEIQISIGRSDPSRFEVTDPKLSSLKQTGTSVLVEGVDRSEGEIRGPAVRDRIARRLAFYLSRYPVTVTFDGEVLDPSSFIAAEKTVQIGPGPGGKMALLRMVEWRSGEVRELLICDEAGFPWHEVPLYSSTRKSVSGFLALSEARAWREDGRFFLEDLDPELKTWIRLGRESIREWVKERTEEEAGELVEEWKQQGIYPYSSISNGDPVQVAERQVFDIVASRVHLYHQTFRESDAQQKHLTFLLVKTAIETSPESLRRILEEVLKLPHDQREDLANLLERSSLAGIIQAAKTVDDRLRALAGFKEIIFNADWRKRLLERTQLHRLLVHHLWIFGEQYQLDTDDENLRGVLEAHLKLIGREHLAPDVEISSIRDAEMIPDLMLSRRFRLSGGKHEHLVLELKRPSLKIEAEQITQLERYASAVYSDPRFSKTKVDWKFVAVGSELSDFANMRIEQAGNLPFGCIGKGANHSIWLVEWADVFHEATERYEFFRSRLGTEPTAGDGLEYLKKNYQDLMKGRGLTKRAEKNLAALATGDQPDAPQGFLETPAN